MAIYKRYLDPAGNDSNAGDSAGSAWLTVEKVNVFVNALSAGDVATIFVAAGTYTGVGFSCECVNAILVEYQFANGVTIDTSGNVVAIEGINCQNTPGRYVFFLRGALFIGNSVNSANGISLNNAGTLFAFGFDDEGNKTEFRSYDDGCSAHGSANGSLTKGCEFRGCTKSAAFHVNSAWITHIDCDFYSHTGQVACYGNSSTVKYATHLIRCRFLPDPNDNAMKGVGFHSTFIDCEIGSPTSSAFGANYAAITYSVIDSFVNATHNGPGNLIMVGCWGKMLFQRIRGSASTSSIITNCVLSGPLANPDYGLDDGNWLGGSAIIRNNIFVGTGSGEVIDDYAAWQTTHLNANWALENNVAYNFATVVGTGITIGSDTITTDPNVGDFSTLDLVDWGWSVASSADSAGVFDSNIGLAAPAIVSSSSFPIIGPGGLVY